MQWCVHVFMKGDDDDVLKKGLDFEVVGRRESISD